MKLNGTHKSKASSAQVFNAILNPEVLKSTIPGCEGVTVTPNQIQANITTSLPGLHGPFAVFINILKQEAPHHLELQVVRQGRGGSVNALSNIHLTDEADGTLIAYDVNADLSGTVAILNNPIGQGVAKNSLNTFFKNLDKALESSAV